MDSGGGKGLLFCPVPAGDGVIEELGGEGVGEGNVLPVTEVALVVTAGAVEGPAQEEVAFGYLDDAAACIAFGDDGGDFFFGDGVKFKMHGDRLIDAKIF